MKAIVSVLLAMQLVSVGAVMPVSAQRGDNDRHRQNDTEQNSAGQKAINPGWLDKYDGIGRKSDFDSAMKEERAGWRLYVQEKYDLSIGKFKQATQLYPNLPAAFMAMGQAIEHNGGPNAEAEAAYRSAIKLNTDDYRAWHKLAGVLYAEKNYVEATKALHNAISLNPPPKERRLIDRMIVTCEAAAKNGTVDESERH